MSEDTGPWLDMSAYPNLDPEDAVPGDVLDALRDVLRAPDVAPPQPEVWQDALHSALHPAQDTGDVPGHEPEPHEHTPSEHATSEHATPEHATPEHEAAPGHEVTSHWPAPDSGDHLEPQPGPVPHDDGHADDDGNHYGSGHG